MEKRFKTINDVYVDMIKDNQTCEVYGGHQVNALANLLNEQDEEINRLVNLVIKCSDKISKKNDHIKKLQKENLQLKQSQNSKAIEVLEKVKNFYSSNPDWDWLIDTCVLEEYIDNQIAELSVEK